MNASDNEESYFGQAYVIMCVFEHYVRRFGRDFALNLLVKWISSMHESGKYTEEDTKGLRSNAKEFIFSIDAAIKGNG